MEVREIVIAVILAGLGVWLLWQGYRLWNSFMRQTRRVAEEPPPAAIEDTEVSGAVGVDGLVFLFGHDFVRPPRPTQTAPAGPIAVAPLTEETLDSQDWANQLLYAVLADEYRQGCVELRITERIPTLMPPFPHKAWELQVSRRRPLAASPLGGCMNMAFDMLRKRQRVKQASQGADEAEAEQLWFSLDQVIEWILKAVRTEMSFWQRQGIYQDLRHYVQEALVAAGYLIEQPRHTWLERLPRRQFPPNRPAIDRLQVEAESLQERLAEFRRECGSAQAQESCEDPMAPIEETVASDLMNPQCPLDELPLEDCLRISVYEALASLRQLEPDRGV